MIDAASQTLTGGQAIVRSLERQGVDTIFGIPGEQTLALYAALSASTIRHVTARHEQAAGYMADGYARVSGRPGVCVVVTGPGLTNVATPLAQAYTDSVPLLVLSGQIRLDWLGHGGHFHELKDQLGMTRSLVGWAERVERPGDIPAAIDRVFAAFAAGRARGAVLEFPQDVLELAESISFVPPSPSRRPGPAADEIGRAARVLSAATRPAIVVGGGGRDAGEALRALAERLDAPILTTWRGSGAVSTRHPLAVGTGLDLSAARAFLQDCDGLVVLGSELGQTDFWPGFPALSAPLVQVDLDPAEIGRAHPVAVGIVAEARESALALHEALGPPPERRRVGAQRAAALRAALDAEAAPSAARYRPLVEALRSALPPETILGVDLTGPTYWAVPRYFPVDGPNRLLLSGLGTLGYALPGAIGAKVARPDAPVAAIAGDGGFLFTGQELLTASEHELNLLVVVWNNAGFGDIRRQMRLSGTPPLGVDLRPPDFCALARAYGGYGARLEDVGDLPHLIDAALQRRCPTVLEVVATD